MPEQDTALLREVLEASVITKAGNAFWRSYQKQLIALAGAEPEVRRRLLSFVPDSLDSHDLWLDILTRSVPGDGAAPRRPAGWLSMIAGRRSGYYRTGRSAALLDLVVAMAPRLRADGVPVDLFHGRNGVDLDMLGIATRSAGSSTRTARPSPVPGCGPACTCARSADTRPGSPGCPRPTEPLGQAPGAAGQPTASKTASGSR